MAMAVRPKSGSCWSRSTGPWPSSPSRANCGRSMPDYGVPLPPSASPVSHAAAGSVPDTWRRIRERGELVVSMDPANLPYSGAKEERPGIRRRAGAGPGPSSSMSSCGSNGSTSSTRLRSGSCSSTSATWSSARPSTANAVADDESSRGKSSIRGPTTAPATCSCSAKTAPHRVAGGTQGREVATARAPRPARSPITASASAVTSAASTATNSPRSRRSERRRHRPRLPLGQRGLDPARLARPGRRSSSFPDYVPEDHWNIAVAMSRGDDELKRHVDEALGDFDQRRHGRRCPGPLPRPLLRAVPRGRPRWRCPRTRHSGPHAEPIRHAVSTWPRAADAARPEVEESVFRPDPDPLGRRAGGRSRPEQPPLLDGPPRAGRARLRDRRPARRASWALRSGSTGASPRTIPIPRSWHAKRLCDVILGVMPDDRFERAGALFPALLSCASYRQVVRSGASPPGEQEPMAVEEGVAVRGLKGRTGAALSQHRSNPRSRRDRAARGRAT